MNMENSCVRVLTLFFVYCKCITSKCNCQWRSPNTLAGHHQHLQPMLTCRIYSPRPPIKIHWAPVADSQVYLASQQLKLVATGHLW